MDNPNAISAKDDCPHCGRCKHCGRGDFPTMIPYPVPYPVPYRAIPDWTWRPELGPVWYGTTVGTLMLGGQNG